MKKITLFAALSILGLGSVSSSQAGIFTDDLSKCLVRSTSVTDRTDLIRWMFSGLALHPDIKAYANITPLQRAGFEAKAAGLFERLLTSDCRAETISAVKNEGSGAIGESFNVLGQIASRELFTSPDVKTSISSLVSKVDMKRLQAVFKEAGVKDQ